MEIVWTSKALVSVNKIFDFWDNYTASSNYSRKLYREIKKIEKFISKHPTASPIVDIEIENIRRAVILKHFYLFYQIVEEKIYILLFWDTRRDPNQIEFKDF